MLPRLLNEGQKERRVQVCQDILEHRHVARNSQWGAVLGVWGRNLQLPGAEPLALENFAVFFRNNLILELF